jgi:carboxyl-terminal processing protease
MEEEYKEIKVSSYISSTKGTLDKNNKSNNWLLILTPLLIGICSAVTYFIGTGQFRSQEKIIQEEQVLKLNHVLDVIESHYVDSVDRKELIETSISSMLAKLDPHSAYISSKDVERQNEELQGHFGGVGIRFIILRDTLMITNIIPNGPSEVAGLKVGDRILEVDGANIAGTGLKIEDVHGLLKGEFGTKVELKIVNKSNLTPKNIEVTRGSIPLPSIDASFMVNSTIGYIRLKNFSNNTDKEFAYAVADLKAEGMTKLVFDLRNNGGGYLHGATSVADEFLPAGKSIVYTEGAHQQKKEYFSSGYGNFENNELVILVNSGTASASEIVSGAIQDNDRGLIMGRRTFGKGLVQQPINLEDGSEMRLTVSRYYTPTGRCIQKPYGNGIDYYNDIMNRYENGELQELDSVIFENAEKFTTPQGRTVYGGGGIMPDVFIPIDTSSSSLYLSSLAYTAAYRDYCFDYVDKNREKLNYKDVKSFKAQYSITEQMFNNFVENAYKKHGVEKDVYGINASKNLIKNQLKSELATYLWDEEARFFISIPFDNDIQMAIKELNNKTK